VWIRGRSARSFAHDRQGAVGHDVTHRPRSAGASEHRRRGRARQAAPSTRKVSRASSRSSARKGWSPVPSVATPFPSRPEHAGELFGPAARGDHRPSPRRIRVTDSDPHLGGQAEELDLLADVPPAFSSEAYFPEKCLLWAARGPSPLSRRSRSAAPRILTAATS